MEMDFNQERTFFKGHCIEYDAIDMFQMLVDIALEPRSVMAANVAKSKNRKVHDLHHHLHKYDPFSENSELLLRTAYGYNTLGMPRHGLEHNIDNIDARLLQQFVMDNITPSKCLIVASGVKNHREFVDLVKERLGELLPVPEHLYQRTPSVYLGGEYRTWTETPQTNVTLAFQSVPWNHADNAAFHVMNTILGNSDKGLRNRANARLKTSNFVDQVHSINNHFTDSGIFGISVTGAGSHSQDLLNVALEDLSNLRNNISDQELARAKNVLSHEVLLTFEKQQDRLDEIAYNYMTHKDLNFYTYTQQVENLTSQDINRVINKVLQGKPTLLVTGGAINLVPTITDVQRQLQ